MGTGFWKVIICPLLIHSPEPNRDLHDLHDGRDPWRKARRRQAHSDRRPYSDPIPGCLGQRLPCPLGRLRCHGRRLGRLPVPKRLYHVITTLITITAAISYFAMASGHATNYHCTTVKDHHKHVPDTHHDVCRQVFWARYVDWSITTPLLLLDLCLLAGVDGAHTLMAIAADLIMVLTGMFAAYGQEHTV